MSRDPVAAARRQAAHHGVPYVHRDGAFVVLLTGRQVVTHMCSSSGIARTVAAYALIALTEFPAHNPLAVSAMYAEAALRHARRRARREAV